MVFELESILLPIRDDILIDQYIFLLKTGDIFIDQYILLPLSDSIFIRQISLLPFRDDGAMIYNDKEILPMIAYWFDNGHAVAK